MADTPTGPPRAPEWPTPITEDPESGYPVGYVGPPLPLELWSDERRMHGGAFTYTDGTPAREAPRRTVPMNPARHRPLTPHPQPMPNPYEPDPAANEFARPIPADLPVALRLVAEAYWHRDALVRADAQQRLVRDPDTLTNAVRQWSERTFGPMDDQQAIVKARQVVKEAVEWELAIIAGGRDSAAAEEEAADILICVFGVYSLGRLLRAVLGKLAGKLLWRVYGPPGPDGTRRHLPTPEDPPGPSPAAPLSPPPPFRASGPDPWEPKPSPTPNADSGGSDVVR